MVEHASGTAGAGQLIFVGASSDELPIRLRILCLRKHHVHHLHVKSQQSAHLMSPFACVDVVFENGLIAVGSASSLIAQVGDDKPDPTMHNEES